MFFIVQQCTLQVVPCLIAFVIFVISLFLKELLMSLLTAYGGWRLSCHGCWSHFLGWLDFLVLSWVTRLKYKVFCFFSRYGSLCAISLSLSFMLVWFSLSTFCACRALHAFPRLAIFRKRYAVTLSFVVSGLLNLDVYFDDFIIIVLFCFPVCCDE